MSLNFDHIVLLHGRYELPSGSVKSLEAVLRPVYPEVAFERLFVPPTLDTQDAFNFVHRNYQISPDSLLIGLERGGLIACALQDASPAMRFSAVAINSPIEEDDLRAKSAPLQSRLALYSSAYPPLEGRCDWKSVTPMAYDTKWLASGSTSYYALAYLISAFSQGADMDKSVGNMFPPQL